MLKEQLDRLMPTIGDKNIPDNGIVSQLISNKVLANINTPSNVAIIHGQLGHGGSERQLYFFLQACNRQRWRPHLYIAGELGVWEASIRALGIPVTLLTGSPLQKLWQFRRLCQANGIRRCISWAAYTNVYALALLGLGVPCLGSFRNAGFADLPVRHRWLWRWLSTAGLASIVCNSRQTLAVLQATINRQRPIVYIPNGVQSIDQVTQHRAHWRQTLALDEDTILVVGVGRLAPQKNFARFIEAIVLANKHCPLHAVIAGPDLGQHAALQQQIDAAPLPAGRIRLIGPVPDARALLCAADIFMLSSDYEGMPNVVLEAMAAGAPCVCTRVNGVGEILEHGIHGFVTEHHAEALAQALVQLAQTPALRQSMGVQAQEYVTEKYSPATVYQRLWQLCE